MILVDHDIRAFLANAAANEPDQTTIYHGDESCITGIGYDLRTSRVYQNGKAASEYQLNPGESVFLESEEVIQFDAQTIGRVFLKNSRIRMGLMLDAPVYQPGHKTKIYFRLTNVSNDVLKIEQDAKYAMLMFEQLDKAPDEPYNGTYQAEFDFKGLGDYKSAYLEQIQSIEGKVKNIQDRLWRYLQTQFPTEKQPFGFPFRLNAFETHFSTFQLVQAFQKRRDRTTGK